MLREPSRLKTTTTPCASDKAAAHRVRVCVHSRRHRLAMTSWPRSPSSRTAHWILLAHSTRSRWDSKKLSHIERGDLRGDKNKGLGHRHTARRLSPVPRRPSVESVSKQQTSVEIEPFTIIDTQARQSVRRRLPHTRHEPRKPNGRPFQRLATPAGRFYIITELRNYGIS